jgi:PadR family transcriptional regulator AphA
LALITLGVSHGWAVGSELAPDGAVGRIWSLSRPLTYRAIDGLVERGYVVRGGHRAGHGRDRVVLAPTRTGKRVSGQWLDTPVDHLRDVRTELLVKLALRTRAGLDSEPLLAAQLESFEPAITSLTSLGDDDLVDLWRRESARAVKRFLDQALHPRPDSPEPRSAMRISARNQLRGTVTAVHRGEVMSTIKAIVQDAQPLTAVITRDASQELDLAPGDAVLIVVKSTEVMVARDS